MSTFSLIFRRVLGSAFLIAAVGSTQLLLAQGTPGSGGPTPGAPDPTEIPIDGGASLLLAGGAAYALKRLRNRRATKPN